MLRSRMINYEPIRSEAEKTEAIPGTGRFLSAKNEGLHMHSIPELRCFRCGGAFPVTDFLRTKKSGLCVPCWDRKIPGGR
jgi:hypothetical protein